MDIGIFMSHTHVFLFYAKMTYITKTSIILYYIGHIIGTSGNGLIGMIYIHCLHTLLTWWPTTKIVQIHIIYIITYRMSE